MTTLQLPLVGLDPRERAAERQRRVGASPQQRGGAFRNTSGLGPMAHPPPLSVMRDFVWGRGARRPQRPLPLHSPTGTWSTPSRTGLRLCWLGHSSTLVEIDGVRILLDPHWSPRAAPTTWAGPLRFHPPPVTLDELPPLDAVLVSHDHYDHLDASTVSALARRDVPLWITALGVGTRLESMGVHGDRIVELDWWENHPLAEGRVTISATPAQHFSGRTPFDRNRTLWASWVIVGPKHRLFFSGDTGLEPAFPDIARRFSPFDLVMLEVGAFHPAWSHAHLGPHQAMTAFSQLNGSWFLPVHWGTFDLAVHPWDEPAQVLADAALDGAIPLVTPGLGAAFEVDSQRRPPPPDRWWTRL